MKNIRGWGVLTVFTVACVVIGFNRYLMKSLNLTVIAMVLISVVLVAILNEKEDGSDDKED